MKKLISSLLVLFMFLASSISVQAVFDERCDDVNQFFVEGSGCVEPKFAFNTKVGAVDDVDEGIASSILGGEQIDIIKITNPWAAQGQPVIVRFTLENIGDQFGYPWNTIELPPDNYVLMMGVDKDIGIRDSEGKFVDIWGIMTVWEKASFLIVTSMSQFTKIVNDKLKGQVCGYVDYSEISILGWKALTPRLLEIIKTRTGSEKVLVWNCLKIVDKPFFAQEIKPYCNNEIDSACMMKLREDFGNTVTDTIQVVLSSTDNNEIPRGTCVRPHQGRGVWGYLQRLSLPAVDWNIVKCSIGDDGLKPGEKITFDFVVLVPKDAPVVNPREIETLQITKVASETSEGAYTFSATCRDDQNAQSCHAIYAGVYPAQTKNWLSILEDGVLNSLQLGSCTFQNILSAKKIMLCAQGRGFNPQAVGQPIWEGSGIFYIIGPVLKATIEMILWAAAVAGGLLGFSLGGRRT